MRLITNNIEKKLNNSPLASTTEQGYKAKVIVKFFNPLGKERWFVTEGEKQNNGDWLLYGIFLKNDEIEWGYFALSELEEIELPLNLKIEREKYYDGGDTLEDSIKKEMRNLI